MVVWNLKDGLIVGVSDHVSSKQWQTYPGKWKNEWDQMKESILGHFSATNSLSQIGSLQQTFIIYILTTVHIARIAKLNIFYPQGTQSLSWDKATKIKIYDIMC